MSVSNTSFSVSFDGSAASGGAASGSAASGGAAASDMPQYSVFAPPAPRDSSTYGPEYRNPLPLKTDDDNIGEESDSYKYTHRYNTKTHKFVGCIAWVGARAGKSGPSHYLAVGQQAVLADLARYRLTKEHVDSMVETIDAHIGPGVFDRTEFDLIVANGGVLPFRAHVEPEGTVLPRGVPMIIIESTLSPFIVPFLESHIQRAWYPASVATRSNEYREVVYKYLNKTTEAKTAEACFPFLIHDFGVRACPTNEQARIGGMAHLETGALGTDNVPALKWCQKLMPDIDAATGKPKMPGFSVPAGEHNVAYSWGKSGEHIPLETALDAYPTGFLSWPIDSFDCQAFVDSVTKAGPLRTRLMARKGKFVLRPDSPWAKGYSHAQTILAVLNRIKENLSDLTPETGGITVNAKGYIVLPAWLGIIYGDSVTVGDVDESLALITDDTNRFSSQNNVFGVGGNLLQNGITRGWLDFAEKTCEQLYQSLETGVVEVHPVGKDAIGKVSLKGAQKVIKVDGTFKVVLESDPEFKDCPSTMVVMYEDGRLFNFDSLDTIRARVASYTKYTFE